MSSSCTGVYTAEVAVALIEATVNGTRKFEGKAASFVSRRCHVAWWHCVILVTCVWYVPYLSRPPAQQRLFLNKPGDQFPGAAVHSRSLALGEHLV